MGNPNYEAISGKLPLKTQKQVEKGISVLQEGGVVVYPTDTVYGLGASAGLPQAVVKVFEVKQRPTSMPLPLLLANVKQIAQFAEPVPPLAWLLIEKFLPGGLTLVLPKASTVPNSVTAGGDSVALRIPAHPIPVALAEGLGTAIVGTSANLSGQPSPLTAQEASLQLSDRVDLIIDGGRCPGGKESTVVDVTGEKPIILREGAISREEIEQVCGSIL
jgi:L-threonylcarbamoyladenylate synthase